MSKIKQLIDKLDSDKTFCKIMKKRITIKNCKSYIQNKLLTSVNKKLYCDLCKKDTLHE